MKQKLTTERLKELLHYCPNTGRFTWLFSKRVIRRGDEAGTVGKNGYRYIKIDRKSYQAHRLAWLYVYGAWPKNDLDHKNRDKDANWIANLREATNMENLWNTGRYSTNKSGFKGVCWRKDAKKWQAQITVAGKYFHIGYFATAKKASDAYETTAAKAFGAFYRKFEG